MRLLQLPTIALAVAMLCPTDLDAGVPEAGLPSRPAVVVYADTAQTVRDIQAIIERIRTEYLTDR